MTRAGCGVDIDGDTLRYVEGRKVKGVFQIHRAGSIRLEDPASKEAIASALSEIGIQGRRVRVGVTGRDVVIRYTQVPPVPDWQLRQLMRFEIDEIASQGGGDVSADFNLLPAASGTGDEDTVLVALAKNRLLEPRIEAVREAGGRLAGFTPNTIALYNAFLACGKVVAGATLLIAHLGEEATDLVIVQDGELLMARNLAGGRNVFVEALEGAFSVSRKKALSLLTHHTNLAPRDQASYASADEERIAITLASVSGRVHSQHHSAVVFCRSQIKRDELSIDKVFLSGVGGRIRGLDAYLAASFGCDVELLDLAGGVDDSRLEGEGLGTAPSDYAVALGLAVTTQDPDLYSIDILPEPLRRRREWMEGPLWMVAAGVVVLVFLVAHFLTSKGALAEASSDLRKAGVLQAKRRQVAASYESALEEAAQARARIEALEEEVVMGLGLARTQALLQKHLPEDLWITSIKSTRQSLESPDPRQAGQVPVVLVRGRGREGQRPLSVVFREFQERLRAEPGVTVLATQTPADWERDEFQVPLVYLGVGGGEGGGNESGKGNGNGNGDGTGNG